MTILLMTGAARVEHMSLSLVGAGAQVLSLLVLCQLNIQGAQRINQSQQKSPQSLLIFYCKSYKNPYMKKPSGHPFVLSPLPYSPSPMHHRRFIFLTILPWFPLELCLFSSPNLLSTIRAPFQGSQETLLLLGKTWVQSPASTWWLTTFLIPIPGGLTPSLGFWQHQVHKTMRRQSTYTCKRHEKN